MKISTRSESRERATSLPQRCVILVSFFLQASCVFAVAQEELESVLHYQHPDGHRLEVTLGYAEDNTYLFLVHTDDSYYEAVLTGSDAVASLEWTVRDDSGDEQLAGMGTFSMDEQKAVLTFSAESGQPLHGTPLGGTYRRVSKAERLKLAKQDYAEMDAQLNRAYQELRQQLKDRPPLQADLLKRQREWIEYRDYITEHPATVGSGASSDKNSSVEYWQSMAYLTETQIGFLRIFTGESVLPGRNGIYTDARGGHLTIENADAQGFDFAVNVVRGPTFHLGELEGHARVGADGVAKFVDADQEAFIDGKPCTLRFEFDGKRMQVSGENTMYYHGARAFFDGEYFKVSDLPETAK